MSTSQQPLHHFQFQNCFTTTNDFVFFPQMLSHEEIDLAVQQYHTKSSSFDHCTPPPPTPLFVWFSKLCILTIPLHHMTSFCPHSSIGFQKFPFNYQLSKLTRFLCIRTMQYVVSCEPKLAISITSLSSGCKPLQ